MDETRLRETLGEPADLVRKKIADRLNPLKSGRAARRASVVVATGRPDGGLDVSPRGDPAGSHTKLALNEWLVRAGPIFDASLELEFLDMTGPDVREGVAAVREKRPPRFA